MVIALRSGAVANRVVPAPLIRRVRRARGVTDLQRISNTNAATVPRTWNIMRRDQTSRGLVRPLTRNTCYQLSTLQALAHLKKFMNWIQDHNVVDAATGVTRNPCAFPTFDDKGYKQCVACVMKTFVTRYWGNYELAADGAPLPLPHNDSALRDIRRIANVIFFGNGHAQQDAEQFQTNLLQACVESADPIYAAANPLWSDQFVALFQLNTKERVQCRCGSKRTKAMPGKDVPALGFIEHETINIEDNPNDSLDAAFHRHFASQDLPPPNLTCTSRSCGQQLVHRKHVQIKQAPDILRIKLNIVHYYPAPTKEDPNAMTSVKIDQPFDIPILLDLTQYQVAPCSNLQYTLSSVVGHDGPNMNTGHYAGNVQGPNFPYAINDHRVIQADANVFRTAPSFWSNKELDEEEDENEDEDGDEDEDEDDKEPEGVWFDAFFLTYTRN